MQTIIKKWGDSPSVRIPAAVMKSAKLSLGSIVDVRVENGRIVLEPIYPQDIGFNELVAGITSTNMHAEINFESTAAQEAF